MSEDYKGPRAGEFEFFGNVDQITLSFAALNNGPLTEAKSQEVVRTAKLFAPGTIVHGQDLQGVWTVIVDEDGVSTEYSPLFYPE